MYDKKISDEEITLNFHAGLPNAAPLVVDVNVTINEDVKEAKIVLQYADDDYYNATITSTSGSVESYNFISKAFLLDTHFTEDRRSESHTDRRC